MNQMEVSVCECNVDLYLIELSPPGAGMKIALWGELVLGARCWQGGMGFLGHTSAVCEDSQQ